MSYVEQNAMDLDLLDVTDSQDTVYVGDDDPLDDPILHDRVQLFRLLVR
jgi:hypothetical protein